MQTTLLSYNNEGNDGDENDDVNADDNGQAEEWYQNEALEQSDSVQKDKITNRRQKVDIYDNQHVPMNREQLGVSNNFQVKNAL